ncbi:MAG: outer membrane protein assembly factor BamE, partial [Phycisphaerae bacterium]|nr:outer membrane protein assembly factor BamE [Phycisphaerae bacterium]
LFGKCLRKGESDMKQTVLLVSTLVLLVAAGVTTLGDVKSTPGAERKSTPNELNVLEVRVSLLEKTVARLASRVQKLESEKTSPTKRPQQQAQLDRNTWRQLQKGMTKEQVKQLLGEPSRVNASTMSGDSWRYAKDNYVISGSVYFSTEDRVDRWYEPHWR